jgi:hypothetical protein
MGYAFAIVQLVGFVGIFKEKPALFRRYVAINWILLYVGLSVAASYLGISAARHSAAVTACESTFFAGDSTSTTVDDTKGEQICNIFTWATLGVMGTLWVLLFIVQVSTVLDTIVSNPYQFLDVSRSRTPQLRSIATGGSYEVPLHLLSPRRGRQYHAE